MSWEGGGNLKGGREFEGQAAIQNVRGRGFEGKQGSVERTGILERGGAGGPGF
jgi:hypothetical protein